MEMRLRTVERSDKWNQMYKKNAFLSFHTMNTPSYLCMQCNVTELSINRQTKTQKSFEQFDLPLFFYMQRIVAFYLIFNFNFSF